MLQGQNLTNFYAKNKSEIWNLTKSQLPLKSIRTSIQALELFLALQGFSSPRNMVFVFSFSFSFFLYFLCFCFHLLIQCRKTKITDKKILEIFICAVWMRDMDGDKSLEIKYSKSLKCPNNILSHLLLRICNYI